MSKNSDSDSVISAFTDQQTARLTGLSPAQLRSWDRTGFFRPSLAADNRRLSYSRIYTFSDLLSLQVLRSLRKDMGCSLQHLREVKSQLLALPDAGWSNTTLYVLNKKVVFYDLEADEYYEPVSKQNVLRIPLRVVRSDMRKAVSDLWTRDREEIGKVSKSRPVVHNQEVIAGTRITVQSVLDFWVADYSIEQILREFPTLTKGDIESVVAKAA